jgi:HD superfamily phosphodiesterase
MKKTICPGQDTRYWRPGDIFEVECGGCGNHVEFFKDDAARRCKMCGKRIENPKISLGCAQWCDHAKECLGYDPKGLGVETASEISLADRLIEEVKREFSGDQRRITHALSVFEFARDILKAEGGEPKVVIAAALLHDIGIKEAERKYNSSAPKYQESEGPPVARRIMEGMGMDEDTIGRVCDIVGNHHSVRGIDTPEFRIIWDADWLVNIPDEMDVSNQGKLKVFIEKIFKTDTGREIAKGLYLRGD